MCIITITRGSRFGGRGGSLRGRDSWGGDDNRRVTEDHQAAELLPRRGEFFFELQTNHVKICALFL
ncbi:hypothetical protein F2Q69_00024988 [Brassica cretica]|uniref:Uncharacterized protein n=1 Tax=Brassica cretica TaxID=69181 RepID=A0A8S9QGD4_BRACR|nr:hypothetical protein F2Q69_00024988 [Brassica cretica]